MSACESPARATLRSLRSWREFLTAVVYKHCIPTGCILLRDAKKKEVLPLLDTVTSKSGPFTNADKADWFCPRAAARRRPPSVSSFQSAYPAELDDSSNGPAFAS